MIQRLGGKRAWGSESLLVKQLHTFMRDFSSGRRVRKGDKVKREEKKQVSREDAKTLR